MVNNSQVVGTCSLCGGDVVLPVVFWSVAPPPPTCTRCGAQAAAPALPVIPMTPVPARQPWFPTPCQPHYPLPWVSPMPVVYRYQQPYAPPPYMGDPPRGFDPVTGDPLPEFESHITC